MLNRDAIGECLPFAPLNYSISVVVILCDIVIFLLPMPLIHRLHLERSVRLGLTIAFALGLLTTVLSIMRASQIHRIAYVDGDTSYFVIRSGLELNIGVCTRFDLAKQNARLTSIPDHHLLPASIETCLTPDTTQDHLASSYTIYYQGR